ncbi:hypothetical protein G6F31_017564 [Rhizopus arrhizus]|nr:hypothetical protein G6F31_017564 [Rhizopus arrhizus]
MPSATRWKRFSGASRRTSLRGRHAAGGNRPGGHRRRDVHAARARLGLYAGGRAGVADRYVLHHVPLRLHAEYDFADGADRGHRLRGGRRHRGAREHHAARGERHVADAGGVARFARSRLHGAVDEPVAGGGVHPHPADGRRGRAAVP